MVLFFFFLSQILMVVALAIVVNCPGHDLQHAARSWFKAVVGRTEFPFADVAFQTAEPDSHDGHDGHPALIVRDGGTVIFRVPGGDDIRINNARTDMALDAGIVQAFALMCCMVWATGPHQNASSLVQPFWRNFASDIASVGRRTPLMFRVGSSWPWQLKAPVKGRLLWAAWAPVNRLADIQISHTDDASTMIERVDQTGLVIVQVGAW